MKGALECVACSCALSFGGNVFFPSTDVHILEGATVFFLAQMRAYQEDVGGIFLVLQF